MSELTLSQIEEPAAEEPKSFWNSGLAKLIRWLAFIPVSIVVGCILEVLPWLGIAAAMQYKPEFNFLTIMAAVFAVSAGWYVVWFWGAAVFMTPILACRIIAPNRRIGSVIAGTLFGFFQGWSIVVWLGRALNGEASWMELAYEVLFSAIFMCGVVKAYKEED